MPTMRIRDVNINFTVVGEKGPWVVLMTGGRRGFNEFVALAGKLASCQYRVLLHDRRNTGSSDILIEGSEGEEIIWADDLQHLMLSLGIKAAFVGGASSGARTAMIFYTRHPTLVNGLLLLRLTGGDFAANRLPENYYGQFIRAAQQGGMAAVCEMPAYQERIEANPRNKDYLIGMDCDHFIEVMSRWRNIFLEGARFPVMGFSEEDLRRIDTPTLIVPGNDLVHDSAIGRLAHRFIAQSVLYQLPVEDLQVPLVPFEDWAPYECEIVHAMRSLMNRNGTSNPAHATRGAETLPHSRAPARHGA